MKLDLDAMHELCERLKLEAQLHAQEARTANATIAEIYQLVTGATGEPGNWNGAKPVREYILKLQAVVTAAKAVDTLVILPITEPAFVALREALAPFDAQPEASTTDAKK